MVDKGDAHLQRMGLTKLGKDDKFIEHDDDWGTRSSLQDAIRESNLVERKPMGNLFEISETPDNKLYVPCHLLVPILRIKGDYCEEDKVLRGIIDVEEQHDWAMEEAAEWSREYLTSDEIKHKDKISAFNHASDPEK